MTEGVSYSLREAADKLGVSVRSVRRYVRSGQLEAFQAVGVHGPEYRVPETALTAYRDQDRGAMAKRGKGGAGVATSTLAMVTVQLEKEREATQEAWRSARSAWERVADLERELATSRAQLASGPRRLSWRERLAGRVG